MTFFDSSTPVPNGQDSPSVKAPEVTPKQMGFCPNCKQLADFRTCHEGHADYKCPHCSHVFHKTEFCHFCCLNCNEVWPTSRIALDWDDNPICADCDHNLTLADDLSPQPVQLSQANAGGPLPDEDWEKEQSQNDRKTEQSMYSQEWANDVQETPSVKAPKFTPESPSNQAARAEFEANPEKWLAEATDDRDPLFFMGGEYPLCFDKDEQVSIDEWTVKNIRDFSKGTGLSQDQIPQFLQFAVDMGHCEVTRSYIIPKLTWELVDEFTTSLLSPKYPVMDFPALPVGGIKGQLDRMESLLLEIKGAVTIDAHLIGGYSMPFIPPVLDDFDQALEDAKAQQAADESAPVVPTVVTPELLTQDEIQKIYNLISAGLERAEYDRLIDIVVDLNNYAKGGGSWGK